MDVKTIDARQRAFWPDLRELIAHRELLWLFTQRNIVSRYRQMALAGAWSVIEPLAQLLMMSVVFGALLRVDSNGFPYPVFVFAALIPWQLFARSVTSAAGSLQENVGLIAKVYFPRLLLPISAVARDLFDGLLQLLILMVLASFYGYPPTWQLILFGPLVMVLISLAGLGAGLCVAGLMAHYRDVRPALSIALQAGLYVTPILYAPSVVPDWFMPFYQLNPMYWGVEAFRLFLLEQPLTLTPSFAIAMGLITAIGVAGVAIFTFSERMTVDVV